MRPFDRHPHLKPWTRRFAAVTAVLAAACAAAVAGEAAAPPPTVSVRVDTPVGSFAPVRAIGAGVDGQSNGDIAKIYTRPNLRAMRSAGFGALTYRLRTELGVEAWHWNRAGRWSDPRHRRGYWTASTDTRRHFGATYGYRLPRRGDTHDQANDDGYSRLDDGNARSFWKTNPYLDRRYTGDSDSRHPQWIVVDFERPTQIDAVGIDWAAPYARRVRVEYWTGNDDVFQPVGAWHPAASRDFGGRGGRQTLSLGGPVTARFFRLVLTDSSHTALPGSTDIRDRLGFAVREIHLGTLVAGRLRDAIRHAPTAARQTVIYVSSTDPWHRASDIDRDTEQPSFQRVLASGLTRGQPMLTPVPVLYGTPADAAAELRYLRALHAPVHRLEMGEEPDGQFVAPEDYGALYVEFARALHRVDRHIELGGPGYETDNPDWATWPDASGNRSWTNRFVAELSRRGALRDLRFFSFEWYPFDNGCVEPAPQLARSYAMLRDIVARQRVDGLPAGVPMLISEYGYSAFATEDMVDVAGAILNADIVGEFLTLGGNAAYLYGYEPAPLQREFSQCDTWGNLMLFRSGDNRRIRQPVSAYWAARLLTRDWTEPGARRHTLLATSSNVTDAGGDPLVTAYAVRRPDGRIAVLLINKDPTHAYDVHVDLTGAAEPSGYEVFQLSPSNYVWHPDRARGYARPDGPPAHFRTPGQVVHLPAFSVTVARGGS